jgi:hypothetical protein
VPHGQTPIHDNHETVETVWAAPVRALEQHGSGSIYLPPPTWTTLRELEPFTSADEALDWARRREIVRREPRFVETAAGRTLVVPGDPETRFFLNDGCWRSHD